MTKLFDALESWDDLDPEERFELYTRGLALIRKHGAVDLTHEFHLHDISTKLRGRDLEAYIFATEYDKQHALRRQNTSTTSNGSASPAVSAAPSTAAILPQSQGGPQQHPENDEKMSVAIDAFARAKGKDANPATIEKYVAQCRLFLKIVANGKPDVMLSALSPTDMRHYAETLNELPIKVSSSDPRPIDVIIASSPSRMSNTTKGAHARAVSLFLKWCDDQAYSIAAGLDRPLSSLRKTRKPRKVRRHFLDQELNLIFGSETYKNGLFERDSDYWMPLLGLFTGAREAELCQLAVADVRQDPVSAIWCIDINDEGPEKRLKNDSSSRTVPIHSQLTKLGFLDFVHAAVLSKQTLLFPRESRNGRGEFDAFSKRFNRYLKKLGLKQPSATRLDFHSFRHTLQTDLIDQGEEEYVVNALVGHSPAKSSQSVKTYSAGVGIEAKRNALLRFRYNVTLYARNGTLVSR